MKLTNITYQIFNHVILSNKKGRTIDTEYEKDVVFIDSYGDEHKINGMKIKDGDDKIYLMEIDK